MNYVIYAIGVVVGTFMYKLGKEVNKNEKVKILFLEIVLIMAFLGLISENLFLITGNYYSNILTHFIYVSYSFLFTFSILMIFSCMLSSKKVETFDLLLLSCSVSLGVLPFLNIDGRTDALISVIILCLMIHVIVIKHKRNIFNHVFFKKITK